MLTKKLMKNELDKRAVRWSEDCPKSQAQRQWSVIHSLLTCGCTPGVKTGVLFNSSINALVDLAQCTLSTSAICPEKAFQTESGKSGRWIITSSETPTPRGDCYISYLFCLILDCKHLRAWMTFFICLRCEQQIHINYIND